MARPLWFAALTLCLTGLMAAVGSAAILDVPGDHATIQAAIDAAANGDTVQIAAGTYNQKFDFKEKNITVRGTEGAGGELLTTVDGNGLGQSVVALQSFSGVLEKLIIANGVAGSGGGIYMNYPGSPTVQYCTITGNRSSDGGGIMVVSGSPTIAHCTITGNTTSGTGPEGGGIYIGAAGDSTQVVECDISYNTAVEGGGIWVVADSVNIQNNAITHNTGGGIYTDTGYVTIHSNTIADNTGSGIRVADNSPAEIKWNSLERNQTLGLGGGIYFLNMSACNVSSNVFVDNQAWRGGAIALLGTSNSIQNNTFTGNQATEFGGAIYMDSYDERLWNDSFRGNQSGLHGGAIYANSCEGTVGSSTFWANTAAGGGGAICAVSSTLTIERCSLSANTAADGNCLFSQLPFVLRDSIIAFSPSGPAVVSVSSTPSVSYTCFWGHVGGNTSGFADPVGANGNISVNPLFADAANGDLHLRSQEGRWDPVARVMVRDLETSRCIDAGDPALDVGLEPAPNGGRANMGAEGGNGHASKSYRALILASGPFSGMTGVSRRARVTIVYREPVVMGSAETHFSLLDAAATPVAGTFAWLTPFTRMQFIPTAPLAATMTHRVAFSRKVQRKDGSLTTQPEGFSFVTGNEPVVSTWYPQGDAVTLTSKIRVTFDQPMHRVSAQSNLFITPGVTGTHAWSGSEMIFTPSAPLAASTKYQVRVGRRARSATGVELARDLVWSFTTISSGGLPMVTASAAPSSAGAQITVTLAAAAHVSVEVLNLAGRAVATLPERELPAGVSALLWNGANSSGARAPAGRYLLRVRARGEGGAQAQCLAPLGR